MILNQSQSEAVYSALCALNNVGAVLTGTIKLTAYVTVTAWSAGDYSVRNSLDETATEYYDNQEAFATAYELQ